MYESLEARMLFNGTIDLTLDHGRLFITGDGQANSVVIGRGASGAGSFSVTGADDTLVQGIKKASDISGATRGVTIDLKGGDDLITVAGAYVYNDLKIIGGDGNDTVSLRSTTVTGDLIYDGGAGNDTLSAAKATSRRNFEIAPGAGNDSSTFSQISVGSSLQLEDTSGVSTLSFGRAVVSGDMTLTTGAHSDSLVIDSSTLKGDVSVSTGSGNDDINVTNTIFSGASTINAGAGTNHVRREVIKSWDFNDSLGGWGADVAGFDPKVSPQDSKIKFSSSRVSARDETGFPIKIYKLSGANPSGDVLMYLTQALDAEDGVIAGQRYKVQFSVKYLSDRSQMSFADTEYLKVGAKGGLITRSIDASSGTYEVNLDHGDVSTNGTQANVISTITNKLVDSSKWRAVTASGNAPNTSADSNGRLSLLVGTQSVSASLSTVRYASISVKLVPIG